MLHMGYAQAVITPNLDKPVYLAGFGQNRTAVSVHDDLYARAIALAQGDSRVVVVALDLLGLARAYCQEIEQQVNAELPSTQLLIACTHTHHGPDPIGLWGPDQSQSGVDREWLGRVKEVVGQTAVAAQQTLQPAHLRTASVFVPSVVKNARNPHIIDDELTCLQFCHPQTTAVLATWFIYPCHPEVLWDDNPHISSDYCYSLRQEVEAATGAPCLVQVGALGGMMTPNMPGNSFADAAEMGHTLAQAGLAALASASAQPVTRLVCTRQSYDLRLQNPLFQMAMGLELLPNFLNPDGTLTTEASLLRLGDAWLCGVPGELLPALGLHYKMLLRQAGANPAAIIGLVNDELGYILPDDAFVVPPDYLEPGSSYEESMSIGSDAGSRLTAVVQHLIANQK